MPGVRARNGLRCSEVRGWDLRVTNDEFEWRGIRGESLRVLRHWGRLVRTRYNGQEFERANVRGGECMSY
jgi:hypothetical protein